MAVAVLVRRARHLREEGEWALLLAGLLALLVVVLWGWAGWRGTAGGDVPGRVRPPGAATFFAPQAWDFLHPTAAVTPSASHWAAPAKPKEVKFVDPPRTPTDQGELPPRQPPVQSQDGGTVLTPTPVLQPVAPVAQQVLVFHGITTGPVTGITKAEISLRQVLAGVSSTPAHSYCAPGATVSGVVIVSYTAEQLTVQLPNGARASVRQGGKLELSP